jgi:large exoprotein involved in heme utilization and adhesion
VGNILNSLTNGNGGNIEINTTQLELTKGAQIRADTYGRGNAGNVIINATKSVSLGGEGEATELSTLISSSGLDPLAKIDPLVGFLDSRTSGVGNSGNIQINTEQLSVSNRAGLSTASGRQGNAGNIIINATKSVSLSNNAGFDSSVFFSTTVGNSGNIQINTEQLSLSTNSAIITSTDGQGNAGSIIINATKGVSLDDFSVVNSGVGGNAVANGDNIQFIGVGVGNGGNIQINTEQLSVSNSSSLSTATTGQGNAGNIIINATKSVSLYTIGKLGVGSSIESGVLDGGVGNGGNIQITTGQLSLSSGSHLVTDTVGRGNAGNIIINATKDVSLDESYFSSIVDSIPASTGIGNGGNIQITTGQLSLSSGSSLATNTLGQGNAGNIDIHAQSLSLTNGSEILTATYGNGNSGNISVNVKSDVNLSGVDDLGGDSSGLFTGTEEGANGRGGSITVNAGNLRLSSGAVLSARTRNAFVGGDIVVNANSLELTSGGELLTTAYSSGRAGDIRVNVAKDITISGSDPTFNERLAQFDRPAVVMGDRPPAQMEIYFQVSRSS